MNHETLFKNELVHLRRRKRDIKRSIDFVYSEEGDELYKRLERVQRAIEAIEGKHRLTPPSVEELRNTIQELKTRRWKLLDDLAYRAERILDGEQGLNEEQVVMRNERDDYQTAIRVLEQLLAETL